LIEECLLPFARLNNRPLTNKIKSIPLFIIPKYVPYDASYMQQLQREIKVISISEDRGSSNEAVCSLCCVPSRQATLQQRRNVLRE
jgi:hypothetical protein